MITNDGDYCGIREINGKYHVRYPICKLDYMIGLDAVFEHRVLEEVEE
jgi:hypothetical protein